MERLRNTNNKLLLLYITLFAIFCSCSSLKNHDYTFIDCNNIPIQSINISINDYHKRLLKQKEVIIAAVRVDVFYISEDWYYISMTPWISDVDKYPLNMLYENVNKIPTSMIPTEYIKKDNVLYVWHNPEKPLTEEFIATLMKYNLVLYPDEIAVFTTDGKHTYYIFCKSKSTKKFYRKETSNRLSLPHCKCH